MTDPCEPLVSSLNVSACIAGCQQRHADGLLLGIQKTKATSKRHLEGNPATVTATATTAAGSAAAQTTAAADKHSRG